MAVPPRSVASCEASAPPIFPNGVRAAPRITVLGMCTERYRVGNAAVCAQGSAGLIAVVSRWLCRPGRRRRASTPHASSRSRGSTRSTTNVLAVRHERGLLGRHLRRPAGHAHPDRGPVPARPLHELERVRLDREAGRCTRATSSSIRARAASSYTAFIEFGPKPAQPAPEHALQRRLARRRRSCTGCTCRSGARTRRAACPLPKVSLEPAGGAGGAPGLDVCRELQAPMPGSSTI